MRALALFGLAAGILSGTATPATSASVAGLVAYLSRTGSGSTCSLAAPCASMNTAIGVAGAGGVVICLDKGPYGGVNPISFTISISCGDALWEAPGTGVSIMVPGGADVFIEGLAQDGTGKGGSLLTFNGQGSLHLHRVRIGNASGSGVHGIDFLPIGPAKLFVTDSYFYNQGNAGISAGINIRPQPGAIANVMIERTRIENNRFGIIADGSLGGSIGGVVRDSVVAGNVNNGITVSTPGANVVLSIERSTIAGNNFGLVASGGNAGMLVRGSFISANNTGLFSSAGGALLSYRDNSLNGNTTDGVFTGPVGLQ